MTFSESILRNLTFKNVEFPSSKANCIHILFFFRGASASFGSWPPFSKLRDHTQTHHTR